MHIRLATLAAALLLAAAPVLAQQDFSKVEIKTTRLSPTVSMLVGSGGNLAVSAGEDTVFLVDDQYAPLTPKILAAVQALSSKPVQFVLNTHWHGDHTGGNDNLGKAGVVIVAHENVRKRMGAEQFNEVFKSKTAPSPKAALPIVTFTGAMAFHLNGEDIRILHMPRAHTDGDSIVHFAGSDVVHMGDTFFNGMYPFIDGSTGGTIDGTIAACDQVLGMVTEQTKIIPGHGPLAAKADLKAYREMLSTVAARMRKAIAEGQSDEDIAKSGMLADLDDKWGKGFLKSADFLKVTVPTLRKAG